MKSNSFSILHSPSSSSSSSSWQGVRRIPQPKIQHAARPDAKAMVLRLKRPHGWHQVIPSTPSSLTSSCTIHPIWVTSVFLFLSLAFYIPPCICLITADTETTWSSSSCISFLSPFLATTQADAQGDGSPRHALAEVWHPSFIPGQQMSLLALRWLHPPLHPLTQAKTLSPFDGQVPSFFVIL